MVKCPLPHARQTTSQILTSLLPAGEGAPKGRMRGSGLGFSIGLPTEVVAPVGDGDPHPAVPATFSRGEEEGWRYPG